MNKALLFYVAITLIFSAQHADAFIWSFGEEKLSKVADLPNTDEWLTEDGDHTDLYVIYSHGWILWLPLWNWDARYCAATPESLEEDMYFELDGDSEYVSAYGPAEGMIPAWDRFGGKIILALIVAFYASRHYQAKKLETKD